MEAVEIQAVPRRLTALVVTRLLQIGWLLLPNRRTKRMAEMSAITVTPIPQSMHFASMGMVFIHICPSRQPLVWNFSKGACLS